MNIVITTCYFPPIAYLAMFLKYDTVTIEIQETYPKQTMRNRTYIATANGVLPLIVPVNKVNGNHTTTKDIAISYNSNWQAMQWRAICSAYNKSPFFLYYQQDIENIFFKQYSTLLEFNNELLKYFLLKSNIQKELIFTTDYYKAIESKHDFRNVDFYAFQNDFFIRNKELEYMQVFSHKFPFQSQVNILDVLFNLGPDVKTLLKAMSERI